MGKILIGISSCLLGNKVRYSGDHALDREILETLGPHCQWLPVCPEREYGLPAPREPMILQGDIYNNQLRTIFTGINHTSGLVKWSFSKLKILRDAGICGFIFKSKSPSCGLYDVKIYHDHKIIYNKGVGIFSRFFTLQQPEIPVIDEKALHDPAAREVFLAKAHAYKQLEAL